MDGNLLFSFQFGGSAGNDTPDNDYVGVCRQYNCCSLDKYTSDLCELSA